MADEYIRKADAVKECGEWYVEEGTEEGFIGTVSQMLDMFSPADVVQVVRCKDCEWAVKSTELPGWYMCKCEEAFDYYAKPDDFCSYGKRRE